MAAGSDSIIIMLSATSLTQSTAPVKAECFLSKHHFSTGSSLSPKHRCLKTISEMTKPLAAFPRDEASKDTPGAEHHLPSSAFTVRVVWGQRRTLLSQNLCLSIFGNINEHFAVQFQWTTYHHYPRQFGGQMTVKRKEGLWDFLHFIKGGMTRYLLWLD